MLVAYMCPKGQKEGENNLGRSLQKRFMCAPLNFPVLTKNFLILSKSLAIYCYQAFYCYTSYKFATQPQRSRVVLVIFTKFGFFHFFLWETHYSSENEYITKPIDQRLIVSLFFLLSFYRVMCFR